MENARAVLRQVFFAHAVLGTLFVLTLGFVILKQENARYLIATRDHALRDVRHVADDFTSKLLGIELVANRLAATAAVSEKVPDKLLSESAALLVARHPDILAVAIAPNLKVSHIAPLAGNERVIGLDYREVPAQLASVAKAYRTHAPVLSGPVPLIQGGARLHSAPSCVPARLQPLLGRHFNRDL